MLEKGVEELELVVSAEVCEVGAWVEVVLGVEGTV